MAFTKEADFEEAVVKLLIERGWKDGVLKNYTEQQLIQNWANILFENNRGIDRLNDYPLTDGEMQQIMEQVTNAKTPMKLNKFINGKSVLIKRDNPDDKLNFGKEVSLKIYDRLEIAAGLSRYQIAEQPKFPTKSKILNDRRMLCTCRRLSARLGPYTCRRLYARLFLICRHFFFIRQKQSNDKQHAADNQ